jgi:hypothetical protein
MADIKPVYQATTQDLAEQNLAELAEKWVKSWQGN